MTSAAATLSEARRRGVNLSEREGRLAVDAPREVFTPDLREALITHKIAILDLIRSEVTQAGNRPNASRAADLSLRDLRLSKAKGILTYLDLCGLRAELDGSRLVVSDPQGLLTDDDHRELAGFEVELVELLGHLAASCSLSGRLPRRSNGRA